MKVGTLFCFLFFGRFINGILYYSSFYGLLSDEKWDRHIEINL